MRVWPDDENGQEAGSQLAHTVDISPIGGRLGGLRSPLQAGQTILLQRGQNRVQFRVVWTRQVGPGEIQAGIESMAFEEKIWGVDLPDELGEEAASPVIPSIIPTQDDFSLPAAQPVNLQMPRIAVAASLLLAVSLLGFGGYWILKNSAPVATISLPPRAPAVVLPVVLSPPRPYGNVRVIFPGEKAVSRSDRLQVAETPQGHVLYPDAPDANLTGTVGMKAVIATDGHVKEIHVLSGNRTLAEAAVQAVRLWRYTRHELNGEAVEAETSVTISFHGRDAVSISFPSAANNNALAPKTKVAS